MAFHCSLRDNKSPQVSRILFNILAHLNNAVVWMVSTRFQVLHSLYLSFGDFTKCTNYNLYHRHFYIPQLFQFSNYFTPWEFFTSAFADGLLLESENQHIASSLQDSSHYSGRSQEYSSLDCLHSSSYLQVLQSFYQSFGDCTECTNYNWYHRHIYVLHFSIH